MDKISLFLCFFATQVTEGVPNGLLTPQTKCMDIGCNVISVRMNNKILILYRKETGSVDRSSCYDKYFGPKQLELMVDVCNMTIINSEFFSSVNGKSKDRAKRNNREIYVCPVREVRKRTLTGRNRLRPQEWPKKHLSLMVVVDYKIYTFFQKNVSLVHKWIKQIYAAVTDYYEDTFNITVSIDSVKVLKRPVNFLEYESMNDALDSFSEYQDYLRRATKRCFLASNILTSRLFTVEVGNRKRVALGLAALRSVCRPQAAAIVSVTHPFSFKRLVKTVIHENAHILGIGHDDKHCFCNSPTGCIMGPQDAGGGGKEPFSDCSIADYQESQEAGLQDCMMHETYCKAGGLTVRTVPITTASLVAFCVLIAY